MAASANVEIDPVIKKAVRLLHSSNPQSATEMRLLLDELIKQRFGPDKMLSNSLSSKHIKKLEEMEASFPGLVVTPPPPPIVLPKQDVIDEVINLTNSPGSNPEESNLKDFGDLNCCVCGEMMITATNRLIECSNCSTLYHQECHKPPITDQEASENQENYWVCDNCSNKPSTSKTAAVIATAVEDTTFLESSVSTRESGSSSTSSSKHHHHHKSTHSGKSSKSSSKDGSSKRKSHK